MIDLFIVLFIVRAQPQAFQSNHLPIAKCRHCWRAQSIYGKIIPNAQLLLSGRWLSIVAKTTFVRNYGKSFCCRLIFLFTFFSRNPKSSEYIVEWINKSNLFCAMCRSKWEHQSHWLRCWVSLAVRAMQHSRRLRCAWSCLNTTQMRWSYATERWRPAGMWQPILATRRKKKKRYVCDGFDWNLQISHKPLEQLTVIESGAR